MNEIDLLRHWHPESETAPVAGATERARAVLADAITSEDLAVVTTVRSAPRRFAGRALVAGVLTVAVALGLFIAANRAVDDRVSRIKRVTLPAGTLHASDLHTPMTILVVGSDSRAFVSTPEEARAFGSPQEATGKRADTMMLVRVTEHQTIVRSIPRDLVVPDGNGGMTQMNAFFDRGAAPLIDAITANFGVTVDHYVQVDFRSFIKVVDAIGGVAMSVPAPVRDAYSGLDLRTPGCKTFDGNQALALVRSRHLEQWDGARWTDASGRSDLDRIDRQHRFLSALAAHARTVVGDDPRRAIDVSDRVVSSLMVDSKMSKQLILDLVARFVRDGTDGLSFATVPVIPSPTNPNRLALSAPGTDIFAPPPAVPPTSGMTVRPRVSHGQAPLGTGC